MENRDARILTAEAVLYADNHLLAVNKPAGLLTQPSGTDRDSLEEQAKAWVKEQYQKPGNVFLEAVHRIDREVSGVVLFARTSKALSRMNEQVRAHNVCKIYHALLERKPPKEADELVHYLKHGSHRAEVCRAGDADAKEARLRYRVIGNVISQGLTLMLVEIELLTGRYHQIRAQCAAMGCPIRGDAKYGARQSFGGDGIALHHRRLEVNHPVSGERLIFEAPYPDCWGAAIPA